ncbi:hypothetical protein GQ53DRAFT_226244 [Thozetella sp. PMI_491]|nr:hypothetical protein GQ53DRAFT_226244 [Thozetella sp. PMI_491]
MPGPRGSPIERALPVQVESAPSQDPAATIRTQGAGGNPIPFLPSSALFHLRVSSHVWIGQRGGRWRPRPPSIISLLTHSITALGGSRGSAKGTPLWYGKAAGTTSGSASHGRPPARLAQPPMEPPWQFDYLAPPGGAGRGVTVYGSK